MNAETVLDAMNYLDDDLIADTGKFRSRKKKSYLYVLAAAAACLCLLLIPQAEKSLAPTAAADNAYSGLTDRFYGDTKGEIPAENAPEVPAGSASGSAHVLAATVRVEELRDDGFICSIVTDDDGNATSDVQTIIQCDAAVLAELEVGDLLRIRYQAGEQNTLIAYTGISD
jgi:hypothetical protein